MNYVVSFTITAGCTDIHRSVQTANEQKKLTPWYDRGTSNNFGNSEKA